MTNHYRLMCAKHKKQALRYHLIYELTASGGLKACRLGWTAHMATLYSNADSRLAWNLFSSSFV